MAVEHRLLPHWLAIGPGGGSPGSASMADLKRHLQGQGVNSRGWRLYLDFGDTLFDPLDDGWLNPGKPGINLQVAAGYLTRLQACEMDVPPPPALARSLHLWGIPEQDLARLPPLLLRAAWKATVAADYAGENLAGFVEARIVPVCRWYFATQRDENANLLRAGWDSLVQRQTAWAEEQRRLNKSDWVFPVRTLEWDAFRFDGLTNEAALVTEGRAMQHCVGEYGDNCDAGMRIYSVCYRRTGQRVATLSVWMVPSGVWEIDQLKGFRNSEPEPRLWRAVPILLDALDQACRASPRAWLERFRALAANTESDENTCDFAF